MNCDRCNKKIGNTLYELGIEGQPNYEQLCPVCWLGPKEGSKPKYHKKDNAWTITKLKAHKDKMKKLKEP